MFILLLCFHVSLAVDIYPDSIVKADHNHHRLSSGDHDREVQGLGGGGAWDESNLDQNALLYEADFVGADRSLIGRALSGHTPLTNNDPVNDNVAPGAAMFYQVERAVIFGSTGQQGKGLPSIPFEEDGNNGTAAASDNSPDTRTVYISINTCLQPKPNRTTAEAPSQLTLYISTTTGNVVPGPGKSDSIQTAIPLVEGFAGTNVSVSSDIYIGVSGPNSGSTTGAYNFEIAASIDAPYHLYNNIQAGPNTPILQFVDSDTRNALLVTTNLTSNTTSPDVNARWTTSGNPFTLFAFSNASQIDGVRNSFCGLRMAANTNPVNSTNTITTRGDVGRPKSQFFLQNLNGGSTYTAYMVMSGNSTNSGMGVIGGGGAVWPPNNFSTKSGESLLAYPSSFAVNPTID